MRLSSAFSGFLPQAGGWVIDAKLAIGVNKSEFSHLVLSVLHQAVYLEQFTLSRMKWLAKMNERTMANYCLENKLTAHLSLNDYFINTYQSSYVFKPSVRLF